MATIPLIPEPSPEEKAEIARLRNLVEEKLGRAPFKVVGMRKDRKLISFLLNLSSLRRPMPKGPEGEKRPADVIGNAVKVRLAKKFPAS